jgi:nucleoside-diphosphate-sugar epimerase
VASLAASRQKLGYVPQVMLRDGLRRYVSWLSGDREALSSPATE